MNERVILIDDVIKMLKSWSESIRCRQIEVYIRAVFAEFRC